MAPKKTHVLFWANEFSCKTIVLRSLAGGQIQWNVSYYSRLEIKSPYTEYLVVILEDRRIVTDPNKKNLTFWF